MRVWDIRTGTWQLVVQGHEEGLLDVDVSGPENLLATASQDGHGTLLRYEIFYNGWSYFFWMERNAIRSLTETK